MQLGPRAKALAQFLHYQLGLSFARCADALSRMFGLSSSRAALCRAADVTGKALAPTHKTIEAAVNTAAAVTADETGWRVGGRRAWLWVVTCPKATLYKVTPGRSFDDAKLLLGEDYAGVLVRDGWVAYRSYVNAPHQSCVAHYADLRVMPTWDREALPLQGFGICEIGIIPERARNAAPTLTRDLVQPTRLGARTQSGGSILPPSVHSDRCDRLVGSHHLDYADLANTRSLVRKASGVHVGIIQMSR